MSNLETLDWWSDLLALKDTLSLRELADRFGVSAGAISASLRRTNTGRTPTATPAPEQAAAAQPKAPAPARRAPAEVPAARPAAAAVAGGGQAWQVAFRGPTGDITRVVVAGDVTEAAQRAEGSPLGRPVRIVWLGAMA